MDNVDLLVELSRVTAGQWGLITAAQADQAGADTAARSYLTHAGLLTIVGDGVFQFAGAPLTAHQDIKVAWLKLQPETPAWLRLEDAGQSGVISHSSACRLHALGDLPARTVEIVVPGRTDDCMDGTRLHRAQHLDTADVALVDGLPVTTVQRTIMDLLGTSLDGDHVGEVVADAIRNGLVSVSALVSRAAPFASAYGLPSTADGYDLIAHLLAVAGEGPVLHECPETPGQRR
ncbi:hypothetical protein [Streptomyces rhizosphaericus]|uniref:hypothetical protein n=1 Tax=Streptomyces rhizosphaericus TaxID=114699 RepID=UPI00117FAE35|nr:hypothetical protein [Streptomyces rhizosphaericus]